MTQFPVISCEYIVKRNVKTKFIHIKNRRIGLMLEMWHVAAVSITCNCMQSGQSLLLCDGQYVFVIVFILQLSLMSRTTE